MGSGTWSASSYDRLSGARLRSGSAFSYTKDVYNSGVYEAHESMNILDKDGNPQVRESRDSEEHPNSTPIALVFDETGSMGDNPGLIMADLKKVFGTLIRKDYVADPQIAIGAYGDAYCDRVPVQFGQFESDNRIDDEINNIFIEGRGGGNNGETSALLAHYIAKYTATDAWDKRHKKGYAFFIGDERSLDIQTEHVREYLGEKEAQGESAESAFKQLQEKWNVWFLVIDNSTAYWQHSKEQYTSFLGAEHVIPVESGSDVAAVIVSIIGAMEQTATIESASTDLVEAGFDAGTASKAVDAVKGLYGDDSAVSTHVDAPVDTSYGNLDL